MSEVRVNPAVLRATGSTLGTITPSASAPVAPASVHPVSVAASEQLNALGANLSQLMAHAQLLALRAAATYTSVASHYEQTDARASHGVARAKAALYTAQGHNVPAPAEPAAVVPPPPVPPHPPEPVLLPHPPAPTAVPEMVDVAAASLHSGDQGASITTMAQTWRTQATTIDSYASTVNNAITNIQAEWSGDASTAAIGRLVPFAAWFKTAAQTHRDAATYADQVVSAHQQVIAEHPTPTQIQTLRRNYANAVAAGNQPEAANYQKQLSDAQTKSSTVMTSYATNATVPEAVVPPAPSPVNPNPGPKPQEKPKPQPDDSKRRPDEDPSKKPGDDTAGSPRPDPNGSGPHDKEKDPRTAPSIKSMDTSASDLSDPPPKPDEAAVTDPAAQSDPLADGSPQAMPAMMPLMQGLTQGLGQAAQMPSSGGQGMPQMPQMPSMPQTPTPPMTPPMTPPTDPPVEPAAFEPMGGGPGGGAPGGGGGGGAPTPAATPGLPSTAAPLTSAPSAVPTGPAPSASAIGAGMPMGMMPHAGNRGNGSDKQRDNDLNPDEPVYVEERPNTSAFLGGKIGQEPPPEAKED
ncbi:MULTISPECIES: WXG100 family type VII secretion target [Mycolicibacterium]|uniref:WXG100 family type VII secretion target n=1 Tax=Mycolicibacterium TaxID=1866885 RepID=UPI0009C16FEA|nr:MULTISPECIES: PPE domain-containing protein [Mycolicibacterium]MCV6998661.1 PPE domain-containing protein [Mycolicibacterium alvei]